MPLLKFRDIDVERSRNGPTLSGEMNKADNAWPLPKPPFVRPEARHPTACYGATNSTVTGAVVADLAVGGRYSSVHWAPARPTLTVIAPHTNLELGPRHDGAATHVALVVDSAPSAEAAMAFGAPRAVFTVG